MAKSRSNAGAALDAALDAATAAGLRQLRAANRRQRRNWAF